MNSPEVLIASSDDKVLYLRCKINNMAEISFIRCCHIGRQRVLETVRKSMQLWSKMVQLLITWLINVRNQKYDGFLIKMNSLLWFRVVSQKGQWQKDIQTSTELLHCWYKWYFQFSFNFLLVSSCHCQDCQLFISNRIPKILHHLLGHEWHVKHSQYPKTKLYSWKQNKSNNGMKWLKHGRNIHFHPCSESPSITTWVRYIPCNWAWLPQSQHSWTLISLIQTT